MKVCRRSFLSLIIGGAAGTTLSPLPWKLMDDSAIWTQMWPWTPVPEDGEVSHVDSICTLCPGGCGITVRKVRSMIGDRAIKIEGMKGHPVNDGGICVLGLSGLQLLYGPTRVKTPLKRVGARGEGKWEKISWDEAIAKVVKKLGELRVKGKSHTVACISGTDRGTVAHLLGRFLTVYGSPNFIRIPSIQDSYELMMYLMQGVQASAGFDVENADFVLSFGSGLIEGWGSPVRMIKANSMWKDQGKVVQIEPRLSNTAAKSDKWIAINPGTEAALALSIAHVIIQKSLYSTDFVNNYSSGFKEFKRIVIDEFSPDDVAKITGVSASTIESLAKTFARASKPLAVCGRGQGETPGSLNEFMAVHALNALVGNINKNGGVWAVPDPDYIKWPEVKMD
ncbi:MAG: molybdopterin-dependent oxidoreductase, partial [Thermodesulfobacteriota bacterium]|nr:molybdopterin-dependent oxidoreductase [Thermodesulfobacteriota bacterium]